MKFIRHLISWVRGIPECDHVWRIQNPVWGDKVCTLCGRFRSGMHGDRDGGICWG